MLTLTPQQVRRLAVLSQSLAGTAQAPTREGLLNVIRQIRCVQIDPIRAVERTQYLVLWSRVGPYDIADFDALLWEERALFEYWAHAASIVLSEDYLLYQPRMQRLREDLSAWGTKAERWLRENQDFGDAVWQELSQNGPLPARVLEDNSNSSWQSSGWSNRRNVTQMLDFLWAQGRVMVAGRQGNQKFWHTSDQWLPEQIKQPAWLEEDVVREAAQKALKALGVGTATHIKKHFLRHRYPNLAERLRELESAGHIQQVHIRDGKTEWPDTWYIHRDNLPLLDETDDARWQPRITLLSPFDNLICDRQRTELIWDFHFRLEIYVPKAKRQYGYYVLPLLYGENLAGRIDAKMDRSHNQLQINAIYFEAAYHNHPEVRAGLDQAIRSLGSFLGANEIIYP